MTKGHLRGDDKPVLCTDALKRFVDERGWTNIAFLSVGEIV